MEHSGGRADWLQDSTRGGAYSSFSLLFLSLEYLRRDPGGRWEEGLRLHRLLLSLHFFCFLYYAAFICLPTSSPSYSPSLSFLSALPFSDSSHVNLVPHFLAVGVCFCVSPPYTCPCVLLTQKPSYVTRASVA